MFQIKAKLLRNKLIKHNYFYFAFESAKIAHQAYPGQFVNIKITDTDEPLLRRPFSIHQVNGPGVKILYEVVGKGTEILAKKQPGEYLDVIGPLGNGFTLNIKHSTLNILVAGGMGVAPLIFLAEKLMERKTQSAKHKILVLIGAKTKNEILCEGEFRKLGCRIKVSTNDGSRGFKGKVSELLKYLLSTLDSRPPTIYACGPRPMLKEIATISKQHNIPAEISLEEHLACGIGACLGCVIKVKSQKSKVKNDFEYKRVCKEGPVFDSEEIIW